MDDAAATARPFAADISLTRLQSAFLSLEHDKEAAEKRSALLEKRLLQEAASCKTMMTKLDEANTKLDEAAAAQEEAAQRATTQRKEQDDERARHELHSRLAAEKASVQQQKLIDSGKQLYSLEEQLRVRTSECSRLRIEQEGADSLISSFQGRLEEVTKAIEATAKAERDCCEVLAEVKANQSKMDEQLRAAQQAQRAAQPREQLEGRLKVALRELADAREHAQESAARRAEEAEALRAKEARRGQLEAQLGEARARLDAAHEQSVQSESQRAALAEQLAVALASSLREQERAEMLVRRLASADTHFKLLHAEVRGCDRERKAHEEHARRSDEDRAAVRAPLEERVRQLEAAQGGHAAELDAARQEARDGSVQVARLKEAADDLTHERELLKQQVAQLQLQLQHQPLFGSSMTCCRCGCTAHATCAGRSAKDVLKQWTCADCLPRLAKRPPAGAAEGAAGASKRRPKQQQTKKARSQQALQQQNLLSLV